MSNSDSVPRICVDRFPGPIRLPDDPAQRLALLRAKRWPAHQRVLHIRFLDGDPVLHTRVQECATLWTTYANVRFVFDNAPDAVIRISFTPGASWSYIGTDARDPLLRADEPTMNFGWLTPTTPADELARVVLHEFGHALGLIHEHQSPSASIPWNREAVYAYFAGPPNYWSRDEVDRNIFRRYSRLETNAGSFDPDSIMLYPIPPEFTDGRLVVGWNRTLSAGDRATIAAFYPFPKR